MLAKDNKYEGHTLRRIGIYKQRTLFMVSDGLIQFEEIKCSKTIKTCNCSCRWRFI